MIFQVTAAPDKNIHGLPFHLTQPTEEIALLLLSSQTTKGSRVEVSQVSPEELFKGHQL